MPKDDTRRGVNQGDDRERVEKTAFMATGRSHSNLSESEFRHEVELLATDSMPILDIETVEVEEIWEEDGTEHIRISGKKNPIYHGDSDE